MSNLRAIALTIGLTTARALDLFAPLLVSAALAALVIHFDIWPELYRPIDAGCCILGRRLFGDHKTWRGVVVVVAGSVATVAVQKAIAIESLTRLCVVDYQVRGQSERAARCGQLRAGADRASTRSARRLPARGASDRALSGERAWPKELYSLLES
jgi:hypothetical protein